MVFDVGASLTSCQLVDLVRLFFLKLGLFKVISTTGKVLIARNLFSLQQSGFVASSFVTLETVVKTFRLLCLRLQSQQLV